MPNRKLTCMRQFSDESKCEFRAHEAHGPRMAASPPVTPYQGTGPVTAPPLLQPTHLGGLEGHANSDQIDPDLVLNLDVDVEPEMFGTTSTRLHRGRCQVRKWAKTAITQRGSCGLQLTCQECLERS